MKTKIVRGDYNKARLEASKCNAKLVVGGQPGTISKWQSRRFEVVFVPADPQTLEGNITIRRLTAK